MMTTRRLTLMALPLLAVLFVAVNVLVAQLFPQARLDLTENRIYTLSEGTLRVLNSLEEPVTLRLFYSKELGTAAPLYGAYQKQVVNILEEYSDRSGGAVRLELFYPEPFSEMEDQAVRYGLQGAPLDQSGAQVYFGLAGTNTTDDLDVIPFLQPERERFLEYDLTRMVLRLANPDRPVVGVISSLPMNGVFGGGQGAQPPWQIIEQIRGEFDTQFLASDASEIPADVDLLMLVQPRDLSPDLLYAIDQFVVAGGPVLAFADPHSEIGSAITQSRGGMPGLNDGFDFGPLLEAWGVVIDTETFVGDRGRGIQVSAGGPRPVQYIAWISTLAEDFAERDIITGALEKISFGSAGAVQSRGGSDILVSPLINSSADAMAVETQSIRFQPRPDQLLSEFEPADQPFTLAARLTGVFQSAYPEGPPEGVDAQTEHQNSASDISTIILVADSDMLDDRFWVGQGSFFNQPIADNGNFVLNALEILSGGQGLADLRSRGVSQRPFTVFEALEAEAAIQFQAQEEALTDEIATISERLRALQTGPGGIADGADRLLSDEQEAEIAQSEQRLLAIRAELRDVQRSLRENVEAERTRLLIFNIGLMPALVVVAALIVAFVRSRRRSRRWFGLGQDGGERRA